MNPAMIIREARADGVALALSPAGAIKARGDKAAVKRWLPLIRRHKVEIVAALQEAANDESHDIAPDASPRHFRWRIHFLEHPAIEASFSPAVSAAGALAAYAGAEDVEPLADPESIPPTAAEIAQLQALVAAVHGGDSLAGQADALAQALADPAAALAAYRLLARERGLAVTAPETPARSCQDCDHGCRPGQGNLYCNTRQDLPPVYGEHHPLRHLPPDGGAACPRWSGCR